MGTMLGGDGDATDIEMADVPIEKEEGSVDPNYHLTRKPEKIAAGQSYDRRFDSILIYYCHDEETWWETAENLLQNDGDFAERVGSIAVVLHAHACSSSVCLVIMITHICRLQQSC